MKKSKKEAVSPIVGTILLLGICVVFASLMFLWVSGFVFQGGFTPTAELTIYDKINSSGISNVTYVILIKVFRPRAEPKDVHCYICDEKGIQKASFGFPRKVNKTEEETITLNGTKTLNITWYGKGSMISSYNRLNLTVYTSNGLDESERRELARYSFYLRHTPTGGSLIGVVKFD